MITEVLSAIATWIGALAAVASASAIWFIWKQVELMKIQIQDDHERSRREMAVNLLLEWSRNLNQNSSSARKIIEMLSEDQARSLSKQEPFKINAKYIDLLSVSLSCSDCKIDCNKDCEEIQLNQYCVSNLRWKIITYLNLLEFVLSAWRHNIADQKIIEEQFEYLINDKEGHQLVKNFRVALGGADVYPSIEAFAKHVSDIRTSFPEFCNYVERVSSKTSIILR